MFGTLLHSKTNGITRQTVVLFVAPSCPLKDPAITPTLSFLLSRPSHFFALGFGLGLVPRAPGTFGTLGGFPVAWALLHVPLWAALLTLAVFVYVGCNVCQQAGDALGIPDHGSIVWDEIVAFALILLFVPITTEAWIASFLLFRFFDIVKPWPIRIADARFKNGFGVILDDLLAVHYVLAVYHGTDALKVASGY